ncbi:MAG: glycosyltransferase family 4 protein [Armatimonadota bacterium]|nr:glycosyltransferase family 4 protein [Armatimonadota bacterium]
MRIVHVVPSPLFLNFLRGHIAYARARGGRISVLTSPGEPLHEMASNGEANVYPLPIHRAISPLHDAITVLRICRILRRLRPHIVHAHAAKGGLLGMVAARLCRVPVRIYHVHGFAMLSASGIKRRILQWSAAFSCYLSNHVLCVSHSVRQVAIEEGLCPPSKIKVLASGSIEGVDAERRYNPVRFSEQERQEVRASLRIPQDGLVIGFVGRLVRHKGITELAEAWSRLRANYPYAHLVMVGDYEEHAPVPEAVRRLVESDPRVHITGWLSDTAPYYAIMHLLVLPSYHEGFPNTLLEAAAMELPVVATDIPGNRDAVEDGKTGTLVPVHDVRALEDAIRRYLEDPLLRQQHGQAGRQRVLQYFRQEILWQALYEEYVSLLESKGLSPHREVAQ